MARLTGDNAIRGGNQRERQYLSGILLTPRQYQRPLNIGHFIPELRRIPSNRQNPPAPHALTRANPPQAGLNTRC
ncbi:MAG: hypothetical protein ACK5EA_26795, partial [Planctomycetaceae bacterium]